MDGGDPPLGDSDGTTESAAALTQDGAPPADVPPPDAAAPAADPTPAPPENDTAMQPPPPQPGTDGSADGDSLAAIQTLLGDKYTVPSWSGRCEVGRCCFEVMKGGAIVEVVDLTTQPCYVVGRQPGLAVTLEHPSVSRLHAVIQLRSTGQVYVYDLNSTHGTFWNKSNRISPGVFVPIKVGDMVRFGQSSRFFILAGDIYNRDEVEAKREELMEQKKEEALRRLRQERTLRALEDRQVQRRGQEVALQLALQGDTCTWGMALGSGTGEEAVVVAAVTADMQDTQFDDEDDFYDRTGAVQKKEARRSQREVVRTYNKEGNQVKVRVLRKSDNEATLQARRAALQGELAQLLARLAAVGAEAESTPQEEADDLDDFIRSTRVQEAQASRQKLEVEAAKVRRELADTEKLLALVRPALPPAAPPATEVVVAAAEAEAAPAQAVPTPPPVTPSAPQGVFSITKEHWEQQHRGKRAQEAAAREERRHALLDRIRDATEAAKQQLREEREEEEAEERRQEAAALAAQRGSEPTMPVEEEEEEDPRAKAVEAKLKRQGKPVAPPRAGGGGGAGTATGMAALLARAQRAVGDAELLDGAVLTVPLEDDDPDGALAIQARLARQKREKAVAVAEARAREADEKAKAYVDSFGENKDKESKRRRQGLDPSEEQKAKKRAAFQGSPAAANTAAKPKAGQADAATAAASAPPPADPKAAFKAVQRAIAQRGPSRAPGPAPPAAAPPAAGPPAAAAAAAAAPVKGPAADWWRGDANPQWVPPADQTGDGRTKLNERFGY